LKGEGCWRTWTKVRRGDGHPLRKKEEGGSILVKQTKEGAVPKREDQDAGRGVLVQPREDGVKG